MNTMLGNILIYVNEFQFKKIFVYKKSLVLTSNAVFRLQNNLCKFLRHTNSNGNFVDKKLVLAASFTDIQNK